MHPHEIPQVLFERFRKKNQKDLLENCGFGSIPQHWVFSSFNDEGVIGRMFTHEEVYAVSFLVIFKARTFFEAEKILNNPLEHRTVRILQLKCGYDRSANNPYGCDTVHALLPCFSASLDLSYQNKILPLFEQAYKVMTAASSLFHSKECVKNTYNREGLVIKTNK